MKLFRGRRVLQDDSSSIEAACVVVNKLGKVVRVVSGYDSEDPTEFETVVDAGDFVLMPGVVDAHVHINEPGRTEWEGFLTATMAAAAGGITTLVDMPLNSIPPTTTVDNLNAKLTAAEGKLYVDVAFWGGVIPGNQSELRTLLNRGVCGFKCFMVNSGVDEFPFVQENDIRAALRELQGTDGVLLYHAELELDEEQKEVGDCMNYETFLMSRPSEMEVKAIQLVYQLCKEYNVRCHIVHLSSAEALPIIRQAKHEGLPLTVETTNHYLFFSAEQVPRGATEFKCVPPIRWKENQLALWEGVRSGLIDMVISDHSPCTPHLKLPDQGDFLHAWGGIASVQFGLSILWTNCAANGLNLTDLCRLMSRNTARLARLDYCKGAIRAGFDADFVIWDPDSTFTVTTDTILHKHKVTPYMGHTLRGVVHKTVVRGEVVFDEGILRQPACGRHVLIPNVNVVTSPL